MNILGYILPALFVSYPSSSPYWINMNYKLIDRHGGNLTLYGLPRSKTCEHYRVDWNGDNYRFETKKDLLIFAEYLKDNFRRWKLQSISLSNNFGSDTRQLGYDGMDEFIGMMNVLVSIARLNTAPFNAGRLDNGRPQFLMTDSTLLTT